MSVVKVRYGRIADIEDALRCSRCWGTGRELSSAKRCPRCRGTRVDDHGYSYETGPLAVAVGSVVLVPPTKLRDTPQEATVVAMTSDYAGPVHRLLNVVEL